MRVDAVRFIPVLIGFEDGERLEAWGRFVELRADGARLLTRARLDPKELLRLAFDLPGEKLSDLKAKVRSSARDADGYWDCELAFPTPAERASLGRVLRRILSA